MGKVIAIDGPAGSGKGTIANILAKKYGYTYIDTGATYRCVALSVLRNNIDITDEEGIINLVKTLNIDFDESGKTYLNNEDVSKITVANLTLVVRDLKNLAKDYEVILHNENIEFTSDGEYYIKVANIKENKNKDNNEQGN